MGLPSRLFTVATTTCLPDCASSASDLLVRSTTCDGLSRCAWSTTRPVSGGKFWAVAGTAKKSSATNHAIVIPPKAGIRLFFAEGSGTPAFAGVTAIVVTSASTRVEVDRGRVLRGGGRLERNLGLGAVEDLGADCGGEGADQRIILPHRLVVIAARHLDAVLGAFELVLQGEEVLIGLEVRIGLLKPLQRDNSLGQPALRFIESLDLCRIAEVAGVQLHPGSVGARFGDLDEHRLFLLRIAFDGCDQVRDQIRAA